MPANELPHALLVEKIAAFQAQIRELAEVLYFREIAPHGCDVGTGLSKPFSKVGTNKTGGASDEHGLVTPLVSRRGHRFNLGRNLVAIQLNTIINIA